MYLEKHIYISNQQSDIMVCRQKAFTSVISVSDCCLFRGDFSLICAAY